MDAGEHENDQQLPRAVRLSTMAGVAALLPMPACQTPTKASRCVRGAKRNYKLRTGLQKLFMQARVSLGLSETASAEEVLEDMIYRLMDAATAAREQRFEASKGEPDAGRLERKPTGPRRSK